MIPARGEVLPPAEGVHRILVLRTAQLREVEWALGDLRRRYPSARLAILGTRLKALGAFDGCEQIELEAGWLTPATVRPHEPRVRRFAPDLVVMCINNEWRAGYERASQVMRRLQAPHKAVAAFDHRWRRWRHADFRSDSAVFRLLGDAPLLLLYPLVLAYLACKPSRPLLHRVPESRA